MPRTLWHHETHKDDGDDDAANEGVQVSPIQKGLSSQAPRQGLGVFIFWGFVWFLFWFVFFSCG